MAKKPTGRPSAFTKDIASQICARLADGQSLREICRDEAMPGQTTIFRWLGVNEAFRKQYASAREAQADRLAEDILDIADDGTNDWMERQNSDGTEYTVADHEHISRSKLRVDARKWLMSKLAPKKYGDKITQEITGQDGAPLVPILNVTVGQPKSDPVA